MGSNKRLFIVSLMRLYTYVCVYINKEQTLDKIASKHCVKPRKSVAMALTLQL